MKRNFKSFLIVCLIICGAVVFTCCTDLSQMWDSDYVNPDLVTDDATNITDSSATLNGKVQANTSTQTVSFVYYLGNYTEKVVPIDANPKQASGTAWTKVTANITGLIADSSYHFRVKITSQTGGPYLGNEMSFRTQ